MSLKVLLCLFLALFKNVISNGQSQNQTDCFKIIKNEKFPFEVLPDGLEHEVSVWEKVVREIANGVNNCLAVEIGGRKNKKRENRSCDEPVMKITFPVISQKSKISLRGLPRPYLATKDTSTDAASQILIAMAQMWKLLALSLMAAAISGITIWFLVSINLKKPLYYHYFTQNGAEG